MKAMKLVPSMQRLLDKQEKISKKIFFKHNFFQKALVGKIDSNLNSVWLFTFGIHKTIKLGVGNFFKLVVKILLDNE